MEMWIKMESSLSELCSLIHIVEVWALFSHFFIHINLLPLSGVDRLWSGFFSFISDVPCVTAVVMAAHIHIRGPSQTHFYTLVDKSSVKTSFHSRIINIFSGKALCHKPSHWASSVFNGAQPLSCKWWNPCNLERLAGVSCEPVNVKHKHCQKRETLLHLYSLDK